MSGGSSALCQGNFAAFHFDIITSVRGVFVALCTQKVCSFSGLKAERAAQREFLDFLLLLRFCCSCCCCYRRCCRAAAP